MQPYPILPVPIPIDEYEMSSGFPFYFDPEVIGVPERSDRPSNRGGMYGGRPEYYQGRPHYGLSNGRFPFDLGYLGGKGYSSDYDSVGRFHPPRNDDYDDLSETYNIKQPEEDDSDIKLPEQYSPECEDNCPKGEIVCHKTCNCIEETKRCDGKMDCDDNEDELECSSFAHQPVRYCNETKNHVLCPRTNRCISKDWLCDGDDDCGDYSDETHCGYRVNCTVDQFQCENGLCIPKEWICDNDNDCKDFSDELNCTKTGCNIQMPVFTIYSLNSKVGFSFYQVIVHIKINRCAKNHLSKNVLITEIFAFKSIEYLKADPEQFLEQYRGWFSFNNKKYTAKVRAPPYMLQTEEEVLGIVEDDPSTSTREIASSEVRLYKQNKCADNEFECSDTKCISLSWKCDKRIDCSDGSDESDCDITPSFCNEDEFQCATHKCIKKEFRCDGDDDCEDWSDEDDCPRIPGNCVAGEFKCNSGKCVPERYICDKQRDCDENEDEAICDYNVVKNCTSDEYTCDDKECILNKWVCDGRDDCTHGEDEANCEIICDLSKFPCSGIDPQNNKTEFCINRKHRCDEQKDCPKGEDEESCPTKRECESGTKCKQLCITTADGKKGCSCWNGYRIASDGYSCEDIDECMYATDPVCSQKCNNTIGSFRCGCMTGYVLRPDLRTCKAVGAAPTLLFANKIDIRQVSLSNSFYTAILRGLHNAVALDYHYQNKFIFWSDVSMNIIRRAYINGTEIKDIIKSGLESPGGIAVDWIHNLIFWTDSGTRRIEVATIDGEHRAIIAAIEVDKPRAISVHPGETLVFWTDWGPNPKIERSEMDGRNRMNIITESVFWPNGLTIDYTTNQLYWADAKHNVIETSRLDGSGRKKVLSKGLPHPFALTIFEDAIFWTDWHTRSISTANKATGAGFRTIHSQLYFPMDIHSYHPQRQPKYRNRCGKNKGGCEHMCLPNKQSYTCVCRMGQKLKADKKTCQKPEKFFITVQFKLNLQVIPVDGIKSAVAIAWESKTDYIYWTDVERRSLNRALWNGSSQEVIVHSNIISPAGISLDWVTDKIYWTDVGTARIEVANYDGTMRSLLVWEDLEKPRDIVVDPLAGLMYWSDWGEKPKIVRANMDRTNRFVIASTNLTWPNGLAVDHLAGKIYWTDGGSRTIEYASFDGSHRKVLLGGDSIPHPFGLDVFGNNIYWTDWETHNLEKANKITGQDRKILCRDMTDLMDVRVFHRNRKAVKNPCNIKNGGCTHLCLLRFNGYSCACPTGIKLGDDDKTCANGPVNFLIMAHRLDIRQISLDVPYMVDVVLPFSPLKSATSVDVDRKTGEIYWTDTAEDIIQKATPDGKHMEVIIMHEMEAPDGIAIDSTGRKIYWTDRERNSVEVAELDGKNRKLLFHRDLDNPRAITLHYHHGLMYWSDWGKHAKIEVAHMDGTHRKTLISKKLNWPNGLAIDRPANRLYWNDGKLNTIESSDLSGNDRRTIIPEVPHPYGLVVVGNHIYWTDWQTRALHRADKTSGRDHTIIRDKLEGLMDVRSVQSDNIAENACGNNNGGCSHLCLRNPVSYTCACPTGLSKTKLNDKQCELIPQTYLLLATRYALSRISLDTNDTWDVTLPIDKIRNVIDVDYHWEKKLIFYTDIERNVIQSVSMYNLSDVRTIVDTNLTSPDGLAVDWIANNIYWTNTKNKVIEVARINGSSRKTVIKDNLQDPRSIVIFPRKGYLFWTDWGQPKIERSYLDGSGRKAIVQVDLSFPIGLVIDYVGRRLYWIDAKLNAERIETTDLHGNNRVVLNIQATHPFSLTQNEDYIFWTDWVQKSVIRAEKTTGKDTIVVRSQLDAAMGLTMVTAERQLGWNPCAVDNGGCSHLCFFKQRNYSCGCPDDASTQTCSTVPKYNVSMKCPGGSFKCDYEDEDYYDEVIPYYTNPNKAEEDTELKSAHSNVFYILTLVPMLFIILLCIILVVFLLIKKGKKKYIYGTSRSFSNPNYYSSNNDANAVPGSDRRQFIWKRLKYDKSQERVYEETVGISSPEIASLIPTILTPCSSNCEVVTPEVERSPSVTPLHKTDIIESVS
ncbi:hypothetical protein NQ317_019052 [Molorchus minor]|uniref:Low-density lipoprotein receptor-related protein 4 n=1 Tax=Molorchus minor TaxID=1323400 RepID=A0ABQ9JWF0_9CUCU|nr:hypothetical protein NQ317_019052 [Molorchus minor]